MAGRNKKKRNGRRIALIALVSVLALVLSLYIYGKSLAHITVVDRVTLRSAEVPEEFDGFRLLFISDLDISGKGGVKAALRLIEKLMAYEPDALLLGGDYVVKSGFDKLTGNTDDYTKETELRREFFAGLAGFGFPNGIYVVEGDMDTFSLLEADVPPGVTYLNERGVYLNRGNSRIALCGLNTNARSDSYAKLSRKISSGEFAISLAHSPEVISKLLSSTSSDGGAWVDLALAGHTHGGQISVGGFKLRKLTPAETRYSTGDTENTTDIIVSEGLGCEDILFRIGTRSQVHLITLRH